MRTPLIAIALCVALLPLSAFADEVTDAVTACDVLTASASDPDRRADPVPFDRIDVATAIETCTRAVALAPKDGKSHFQLGRAYEAGRQNETARGHYLDGAELGSPIAMRQLASFIFSGWPGHPPEVELAFKWFQAASDTGMGLASRELGMNLIHDSIPQGERDYERALKSLLLAIDQGDKGAARWIAKVYHKADPPLRDYAKAEEWYLQAAEVDGSVRGMNDLAVFYGYAEGREPIWDKAVMWFERAIEAGDGDAAQNLAQLYLGGIGVAQDETKAAELFAIGAERGNLSSMHFLGHMYEDGTGVPYDSTLAARYLVMAVTHGYQETYDYLIEYDYLPSTSRAIEQLLADGGFLAATEVDGIFNDATDAALTAAFRSAV